MIPSGCGDRLTEVVMNRNVHTHITIHELEGL